MRDAVLCDVVVRDARLRDVVVRDVGLRAGRFPKRRDGDPAPSTT
ncbi:hypothetical protein AB0I16_11000 [Streptomyces sp. NPDC050703]